jgi:thiamine-phosphate pyrophosphorylase
VTVVPRLHVITDRGRGHTPQEIVEAAVAGGADLVQLRDKSATEAEMRAMAAAMAARCAGTATRALVNDWVDVAASLGLGAHVGHGDLDPWAARARLGPGALLGATANNLAELAALADAPIDYVGVGPVFGTQNKTNPAPTLGLEGLAEMVRAARVPVIAIGSVGVDAVPAVLETGAWGIAVIGAVTATGAPPAVAVAALARALQGVLGARWARG